MKKNKNKQKAKAFFQELKFEIRKIEWPKRDSVIRASFVIILIMVFSTLFVMFSDLIFSKIILILKNNFLRIV